MTDAEKQLLHAIQDSDLVPITSDMIPNAIRAVLDERLNDNKIPMSQLRQDFPRSKEA